MSVKYTSRRKTTYKQNNTKRHKHYIRVKKHSRHTRRTHKTRKTQHNVHNNQNYSEHVGHGKVSFDKKHEHLDKVNLILSNVENKKHGNHGKHGNSKSNYRHYRRGF